MERGNWIFNSLDTMYENPHEIFNAIEDISEQSITAKNIEHSVENIRLLSEYLIYSNK